MKPSLAVAFAVSLTLALGACSTPGGDGDIASWGSMREVMREGRSEARVTLVEALRSPSTVGIGAMAGLRGEVAIVDGVVWVGRVDGAELECARDARPGDAATLLITAEVPVWRALMLDHDIAASALDELLASIAEQAGFPRSQAWPCVIQGELFDLEAHVLRGQCPFAGTVDAEHEPIRRSLAAARGRLVGFYAPEAAGELVHHGQASHLHVVVEQPALFVGHVDAVGVRAGALIWIPATR